MGASSAEVPYSAADLPFHDLSCGCQCLIKPFDFGTAPLSQLWTTATPSPDDWGDRLNQPASIQSPWDQILRDRRQQRGSSIDSAAEDDNPGCQAVPEPVSRTTITP